VAVAVAAGVNVAVGRPLVVVGVGVAPPVVAVGVAVGVVVGVAVGDPPTLSAQETHSRPPVTTLPDSESVVSALPSRALLICVALSAGWAAAYSAAAPVTCGVDMEVPSLLA
jgi:hypothetical protein